MIVLDTHSWIWWLSQPDRLSPRAARAIEAGLRKGPVLASSISVWELYLLVARGRLALTMDTTRWVRQCELSEKIRFVPFDNDIARISVQLADSVPEDPADRMIVATALAHGATLVTKDAKIQRSDVVATLW
jgi:PIN domain nuclease of toxin-antitoxin system